MPQGRAAVGITDDVVRISVGLEDLLGRLAETLLR